MALRFFADHCVSRFVMDSLRDGGHHVEKLSDHLPTDAADPIVITKAQELDAILLTLNGDFADVVTYPPADYKGIIGLQVKNHPKVTGQIMIRLLDYLKTHPDSNHFVGKLFLVEVHRIRIRG